MINNLDSRLWKPKLPMFDWFFIKILHFLSNIHVLSPGSSLDRFKIKNWPWGWPQKSKIFFLDLILTWFHVFHQILLCGFAIWLSHMAAMAIVCAWTVKNFWTVFYQKSDLLNLKIHKLWYEITLKCIKIKLKCTKITLKYTKWH